MSLLVPIFLLLLAVIAPAQQPASDAELNTRDVPATFQSKVNLVLVPVVVRDSRGRPVEGLRKEDFQLFDRGKVQTIAKFSVEKASTKPPVIESAETKVDPAVGGDPSKPAPPVAERFTAYLFDDIHLKFGDLAQARNAAMTRLEKIDETERVAIYTTSGQLNLDFTDDPVKIKDALLRLRPAPTASYSDCPPIDYYMADLIVNKDDSQALQVATQETMECQHLDPTMASAAAQQARMAASMSLSAGGHETRLNLLVLKNVVRRLSATPGQRVLVMVSPGFFAAEYHQEVTEAIDAAIRVGVVMHAIDARGLYVPGSLADASQRMLSPATAGIRQLLETTAASVNAEVLHELADGTGGLAIVNTNDLKGGFERAGGRPEVWYVLGFSPQNLKYDGTIHKLQVKVNGRGYTLQARRAYSAPKHLEDASEEARREIGEALFSRETLQDIPIDLSTQFFKSGEFDAKLSVVARIDVRRLKFRKEEGRDRDDLQVVCGLFDRNGNFIASAGKSVEMRLRDGTLTKLERGIFVRNGFDVKTGGYVIRLVVRDSEGKWMAARNGWIEIP